MSGGLDPYIVGGFPGGRDSHWFASVAGMKLLNFGHSLGSDNPDLEDGILHL